ncbi:hypothetical protein SESBI_11022 [Sesbania bispinosa]|nr:hypothetical protein SESBI_11022 [Sesbania bispinosa]
MNPLPNEREEDWLGALLRIKIGNCEEHQDLKFNEKNVFCVDCAVSFCRYCKEAHSLHRRFQIYKYCYHDVVRHSDLHKYFDCSNIQTYISNNDKIVHLKPRPSSKDIKLAKRSKAANRSPESQAKETKTSTPPKWGGSCEECGRHLQDNRNRFCSITCKISVEPQNQGIEENSVEKNHSSQRISEEPVNQNDNQISETEISSITVVAEPYECVEKVNFRKRPRKSTPHRAPFF